LAFFVQNTASFFKISITTLSFRKTPFFRRKLQKIVIITSAPGTKNLTNIAIYLGTYVYYRYTLTQEHLTTCQPWQTFVTFTRLSWNIWTLIFLFRLLHEDIHSLVLQIPFDWTKVGILWLLNFDLSWILTACLTACESQANWIPSQWIVSILLTP
jgi:hypothetical protein